MNVYFDDFKVTQTTSNVLEENHYYPFGMLNAQLSVQPTDNPLNYYKYNGKELQKELNLEWLDYGARFYDAQVGRWHSVDPKAELLEISSTYVYGLNCPLIYLDRDGELPILINGRVGLDSERANASYWSSEIIATIKGSGIPNPGGQIHYVDGDRWYSHDINLSSGKEYGIIKAQYWAGNDPYSRYEAGYKSMTSSEFNKILSKLERNTSGKIIEKIQIYTHSRGAAFGQGYTQKLLEFIKQNASEFQDSENVIDFSYNMAPHQSWSVSAVKGVSTYSQSHTNDYLSGNNMNGVKAAFKSNEGKGMLNAHSIKSFARDLREFTKAFQAKTHKQDEINSFIQMMQNNYGITVTVTQ